MAAVQDEVSGHDLTDPRSLTGRWRWARRVDDRLVGSELSATGTLELTPLGRDLLAWTETGLLVRPDGSRVDVRRALRLERRPGGWWVTFEDGRDFHPWTPGEAVVHPCAEDTYRGRISALSSRPLRWRVVWDVVGPAKDHTIVTDLAGWVALSEPSPRVEP